GRPLQKLVYPELHTVHVEYQTAASVSSQEPMRLLIISILALISTAPLARGDTPSTRPVEIRRGLPMNATRNPDERARMGFAQLIQRIEPSAKGDPERLDFYVDAFQHEYVQDPRLFAATFHAMPRENRAVELTGQVEYSELRQALGK